jgi:hypothetical protein
MQNLFATKRTDLCCESKAWNNLLTTRRMVFPIPTGALAWRKWSSDAHGCCPVATCSWQTDWRSSASTIDQSKNSQWTIVRRSLDNIRRPNIFLFSNYWSQPTTTNNCTMVGQCMWWWYLFSMMRISRSKFCCQISTSQYSTAHRFSAHFPTSTTPRSRTPSPPPFHEFLPPPRCLPLLLPLLNLVTLYQKKLSGVS